MFQQSFFCIFCVTVLDEYSCVYCVCLVLFYMMLACFSPPGQQAKCSYQNLVIGIFIKAPLATARAPLRIGSVHLFVCLFVCLTVCLSPECVHKNAILSKSKQFTAMISIDDLQEVTQVFEKAISGPLKFKMAEIRHLDNREIALSQRKIIHDSHVTKYESFKNSRWRSAAVLKIILAIPQQPIVRFQ